MATLVRSKTWVDAETLVDTEADDVWDDLFTFFSTGGSVVHNDGTQAFSADVTFPLSFASENAQAVRKRQADMSPELIGGSSTCWLHGAAHLPALGTPYLQAGDSVVSTPGFGVYDIPLPTTFSTDILTAVVSLGAGTPTGGVPQLYVSTAGSSTSNLRVITLAANPQRFSWIVVGW